MTELMGFYLVLRNHFRKAKNAFTCFWLFSICLSSEMINDKSMMMINSQKYMLDHY
jgi:hypothetical protein